MLTSLQQYILNIIEWLQGLPGGPWAGLGAPFLEAIFPFLPLVLIISANAATYGFWLGVLLSWIGSLAGTLLVFAAVRYVFRKPMTRWLEKHKQGVYWLDRINHMSPISLGFLYSLPFIPVSLITYLLALIQMPLRTFVLAAGFGKLLVVIIFSVIGDQWQEFIQSPFRLSMLGLLLLVLWAISRGLEELLKRRAFKKRNEELKRKREART
ncbi:DedA family protein [Exiguobacterium sp. SH3S2]|uniref:TVP38/TMEM64 family protein n=1 Tax=Exiguobacterium TaxID=33986 RepID=UPI000877936D|nr:MULTISPECIES: VTT domain-containing protein [Exiguobacterium]OGX78874.1 SNARE associated Golgi family protein [Exiguobacterium sp. SH31]TCI25032.1 DedA family protein [Exiguobacterium sp. SH5S4]TCI47214.1 DedA family protein [Exiguobacterium sp. SH3S3]TCI51823.1 DedA family protein [Exiguobacterium sp. SH5S13]TCI62279.1 DedA family protein [Exiguobacterium sp. SH3S1]